MVSESKDKKHELFLFTNNDFDLYNFFKEFKDLQRVGHFKNVKGMCRLNFIELIDTIKEDHVLNENEMIFYNVK